MPHEKDVRRPWKVRRVLRAADQEAQVRPGTRGGNEKSVESSLAILRIGSEIGKVGAIVRLGSSGPVNIGVDMTVERFDALGAEQPTKLLKDPFATGETQ